MLFFDVKKKVWKQLSSLAPAPETKNCYCAEIVGRELFVSGKFPDGRSCVYCYDIETNKWHTHEDIPPYPPITTLCAVSDYMYALPWDCSKLPQRYSFAKHRWQSFSKSFTKGLPTSLILTVPRSITKSCMHFMGIDYTSPFGRCKMQRFIVLIQ